MTSSHRGLWIGVGLGAPLIALAAVDALASSRDTRPRELLLWLLAVLVLTDLLVLPTALGFGHLVRGRPWMRWAMSCAAIVVLVSWPFVRGYGRDSHNPSALPRNYAAGSIIAIAGVAATAGVGALAARGVRARRRSSTVAAQPASGTVSPP